MNRVYETFAQFDKEANNNAKHEYVRKVMSLSDDIHGIALMPWVNSTIDRYMTPTEYVRFLEEGKSEEV